MNEADSVTLTFSLARLNPIRHRYDLIFLRLHRFEWTQRMNELNFFYPDCLLNRQFDPSHFDELIYPFLQDPMLTPARLELTQTAEQLAATKARANWTTNQTDVKKWFFGVLSTRD